MARLESAKGKQPLFEKSGAKTFLNPDDGL
jgi:hypothetical protein